MARPRHLQELLSNDEVVTLLTQIAAGVSRLVTLHEQVEAEIQQEENRKKTMWAALEAAEARNRQSREDVLS